MNERRNLKFAYRGCTLIVSAMNMEAGWYTHFHLKFPRNAKEATLWGDEGPYASADEALEKARSWALRKIKQQRFPAVSRVQDSANERFRE
jgi:hypothetical protein